MTTTEEIPVSRVRANPQDRKEFDERELRELATSIRNQGLLQPITVRPEGDEYVIVAGERRWRAHVMLGKPTIEAIVRTDMTARQASDAQLVENVIRTNLNPVEEAEAYQRRMSEFKMSVAQLARRTGKSEKLIEARLALLTLDDTYRELVRSGDLNVAHGQAMAGLDVNRQRLAMKALAEGKGLSLWQFQALCDRLRQEQAQDSMFDPDAFLRVAAYQDEARKGAVIRIRDIIDVFERSLPTVQATRKMFDEQPATAAVFDELIATMEHAIATRGSEKASKGSAADRLAKKGRKS